MELELKQEHAATAPPIPVPATGRATGRRRLVAELLAKHTMALLTGGACLLILLIASALITRAWPLLTSESPLDLITNRVWQPMQGLFGFAPFIAGSLAVTLVAMGLAVVPAVFSAIYLAEYTSRRLRTFLKPIVDLLVGIPSVVYGLWAVLFIVPLVRDHLAPWAGRLLNGRIAFLEPTNPSGYGVLAGGVVLAVMVFPLIVAVIEEVLRGVPGEMREALLSLGATRWEATKCVVRRCALPGVVAAIVLGFSRAFGETLAVMMVVGNTVQIPHSLFDSAYPLPALIANNYGEMMSIPHYEAALMTAALLLFVVVLAFNAGARLLIVRLGRRP